MLGSSPSSFRSLLKFVSTTPTHPWRRPEIFEAKKRLAQPYFEIIWNILMLYGTLEKLDLL
jgi:hypothetical protein